MNRKISQFSIRLLLVLICVCSVLAAILSREPPPEPPAAYWRESSEDLKDFEPLENAPTISAEELSDIEWKVSVTNHGQTTLIFWQLQGGDPTTDSVCQYDEDYYVDINGRKWHSCRSIRLNTVTSRGTTFGEVEIAPNETVQIPVWLSRPTRRERVLTLFAEKNTNRRGLVVLVTMPKQKK